MTTQAAETLTDTIGRRLPPHLRRPFRTAMFTRGGRTERQAIEHIAGRPTVLGRAVALATSPCAECQREPATRRVGDVPTCDAC